MWRKLVSYLIPVNVKKITSTRSGSLEVTLVNGKYILDANTVNYSYGSLQKVLKKGLNKIGTQELNKLNNILVLGVAGGSVIQTIRNDFNLNTPITGVEIDPEVLQLAEEYYNLSETQSLQLIQADAFQYVKNSKVVFDLIIIDIFNDEAMPPTLYTQEFWNNIYNRLQPKGWCIFNSITKNNEGEIQNKKLIQQLQTQLQLVRLVKTQIINQVLIFKKS